MAETASRWSLAAFEARALVDGKPWCGGEWVPVLVNGERLTKMRIEWPKVGEEMRVPTHVELYFGGRLVSLKPVPMDELDSDKIKKGGVFSTTFPFSWKFD